MSMTSSNHCDITVILYYCQSDWTKNIGLVFNSQWSSWAV